MSRKVTAPFVLSRSDDRKGVTVFKQFEHIFTVSMRDDRRMLSPAVVKKLQGMVIILLPNPHRGPTG
jgi:hypothetical protein